MKILNKIFSFFFDKKPKIYHTCKKLNYEFSFGS